jgi:hypothetical protein
MDMDELRNERRSLRGKIYNLRKDAKDKCLSSNKESKKDSYPDNTIRPKRAMPPSAARISGVRQDAYVRDCIENISSEPLIMELEKKKRELERVESMESEHNQNLRKFTKEYTQQLIKQFAEPKYEIVVSKGDDVVLYDSKGLMLDITNVLLEKIKDKDLVLTKNDPVKQQ